MGVIEEKRLKRLKRQTNPTNPSGNTNIDTNKFDIEKKTIKGQQNKR